MRSADRKMVGRAENVLKRMKEARISKGFVGQVWPLDAEFMNQGGIKVQDLERLVELARGALELEGKYLVFVWGDLEPEMKGPFGTDEARDVEAKRLREEEGDQHGIYPLDIKGGKLEIGTYSGAFFGEDGEEDE